MMKKKEYLDIQMPIMREILTTGHPHQGACLSAMGDHSTGSAENKTVRRSPQQKRNL